MAELQKRGEGLRGWEKRNLRGRKPELKVGFLPGQTYEDGTSVAEVAAKNEYGSGATPPRPFMRKALGEKTKWTEFFAKDLAKSLAKDSAESFAQRVVRGLGRTGLLVVSDVQESIGGGGWAGNSATTIKRKGFDKPLIDSGQLLRSVDFEVDE